MTTHTKKSLGELLTQKLADAISKERVVKHKTKTKDIQHTPSMSCYNTEEYKKWKASLR